MESAPAAPTPPDPVATASAQAEANAGTASAQTALNNVNMNTPYGNTVFAPSGSYTYTNPDGTQSTVPTYTEQENLSAPQQHLYNQQTQISSQMNNDASQLLNNARSEIANPTTMDSLPGLNQSFAMGGNIASSYDMGGPIANTYASGGAIQGDVPVSQAATTFGNTATSVQGDVDMAGINQARDDATNAALARLQPSVDQSNNALQSQLANQGVAAGSDAYSSAMLGQAQANNDLRLGAVQTGDQEQQAAYSQALSSGQFHNAAQEQDYEQQQGRGLFALQATEGNNAANLAAGQFHNAAQEQGEEENAARAAFGNQAQLQQNQENAASAAFYDQAQQQWTNENQAEATFQNQAREQYLNDSTTLNNQAINQASVLEHGGQVTAGQYQGYTPGQVGSTPISQDTYASANLAEQEWQTQSQLQAQNNSAMFGAIGGLMKMGMGGFM